MKPGYQTSEFWLHLIAVVLGAVASSGLLGQGALFQAVGLGVTILGALGYTTSRTLIKASQPDPAASIAVPIPEAKVQP